MRRITLTLLFTICMYEQIESISIAQRYALAYQEKENDNMHSAIALYKEVLSRVPTHEMAHLGIAQCYLTLSEYEQAWPHFEYRGPQIRLFTHYNWQHADLTDKRIVIRAEWGFGDCIQFIRYAQMIKDRGGIVYVQAYSELVPLFSLCPYIDQVISTRDPFPEHDIQVPLLSLPYIFGTGLHTIPTRIPYLYADQDYANEWAQIIDHSSYNIGICWFGSGAKDAPRHLNKNMSPLDFEPLTHIPNCKLYALQKIPLDDPAHALCYALDINTFDKNFDVAHGSFMDTAALMQHLDCVISIDTSIAHLAGALGKEVYILLPFKADWRWLQKTDRSPWYPTAHLLRQPSPGDFSTLIHNITRKIRKKLKL